MRRNARQQLGTPPGARSPSEVINLLGHRGRDARSEPSPWGAAGTHPGLEMRLGQDEAGLLRGDFLWTRSIW